MIDEVNRTPRTRRGEDARSAKKPYRKPRVESYGSVVELTQTGSGTIEDAGVVAFSGAAG